MAVTADPKQIRGQALGISANLIPALPTHQIAGCLSEFEMQGRLTTAQAGIVHAGEIVEYQRTGVQK